MSRDKLVISDERVKEVNDFLLDTNSQVINDLIMLVEKHGGVEEINRKAAEAGKLENLLARMEAQNSPHLNDIHWLMEQRDANAFIKVPEYRRKILGDQADSMDFDEANAVTLEISACQYFSYLIAETKQAIEKQELMPGRIIRVRIMKEQEQDGDLLAMEAACKIIGASKCETLDSKGT